MTTKVCSQSPTLSALKNLTSKHTEPVKRIAPKTVAVEAEYTPRTNIQKLIAVARAGDYNGRGMLSLGQARHELADDSLQLKDLIELFEQYAPAVEVTRHPKNMLHLRFCEGKRRVVSAVTELKRVNSEGL